jgi:hypothetical protein
MLVALGRDYLPNGVPGFRAEMHRIDEVEHRPAADDPGVQVVRHKRYGGQWRSPCEAGALDLPAGDPFGAQ